jgi:hypothetical protein
MSGRDGCGGVNNLGQFFLVSNTRGKFWGNSGGKSEPKMTQTEIMGEFLVRLARARKAREKFGGGEWSRTTDAADMSRVI